MIKPSIELSVHATFFKKRLVKACHSQGPTLRKKDKGSTIVQVYQVCTTVLKSGEVLLFPRYGWWFPPGRFFEVLPFVIKYKTNQIQDNDTNY